MAELDDLVDNLGRHYTAWKHEEKMKNKFKEEFFEAATEELKREVPAQIYEKIAGIADENEARRIARKKFPTFRILDALPEHDGFRVVLEEDPELRSFAYEHDGWIYQRQVTAGSVMIDDDRLKETNPDLWQAITRVPTERVMKPLEDLSPEELAALEPYLYSSKPVIKLAAPRKVNEDLDNVANTTDKGW